MKNIMNGKVAAGLIAVSSLWSAWGAIANTSNQSKEEISKVLVVDQEGKENTEDKKTIDFQQARKSWEVKKSPETKNIAGENLILDEQGVEEYFAQHGTVPYLSNGATIDGEKIINSWVWNESYCYFYLSNNDSVILDVSNIDHFDSEWWCEDIWGGKIKITWHAVITIHKGGTYTHVTINNGANFTEENAEGKEIAHTDTLYFSNEVWNIPEEIKEQLTKGKWFYTGKIGLPKHHDPEYLVGYTQRISGNSKGRVDSEWGDVGNNDFPFNHYVSLEDFIKEADCTPYKEVTRTIENIWGKNYECILKFYSIIPIGTDWSTAHASIVWWGIPGKRVNFAKIEVKEIVTYGKMDEGYDSTQIEAPKYYDNVGKEVAKDSLELGKTYQLKVQAKRDYKITSVIVNEEEYTPTEEGSFTINFEVKENNKIEIKSSSTSGIEWTEVKEPGISSENGILSIDTQDTPLQSIQIYDLKGQLIAQKSKPEWVENFHLSQGLYLVNWRTVKGESKTAKVMVK